MVKMADKLIVHQHNLPLQIGRLGVKNRRHRRTGTDLPVTGAK